METLYNLKIRNSIGEPLISNSKITNKFDNNLRKMTRFGLPFAQRPRDKENKFFTPQASRSNLFECS